MSKEDRPNSPSAVKFIFVVVFFAIVAAVLTISLNYDRLTDYWLHRSDATVVALPEPIGPLALNTSSVHGDLTYVGAAKCRDCHTDIYDRWKGSHHDLAMMAANEASVIGDFDNATFTHHDVTTTFFRQGDDYLVRTVGGDNQQHEYKVLYTFGITPLQQYLVEFPGGRLQTLPFCWDARPTDEGGQRWYHLYGDEDIPPGDELFWTGPAQNWNFACAECHSTNLRKNYDVATDSYHTTFSEVNVACEACHGPGSGHLAWAEEHDVANDPPDTRYDDDDDKGMSVRLKDRTGGQWQYDEDVKTYLRTKPLASRVQLDTCARCHSRRSVLTENYHHGSTIHDTHRVSTLEPPLYELTGVVRDEDYVYGSFVQSKMYHQGVRCVDCHDPHSLQRHRPGNTLCTHCHQLTYDAPEHHFHPAGGQGTQCIECHMPERTYMGVDKRSDHSFRIPRPDLSVKYGSPNMCNDCHTEESFEWAAEWVEKWYGPRTDDTIDYAAVLNAATVGHPDALKLMPQYIGDTSFPAIRRATLLRSAGQYMSREMFAVVLQSLQDPEPMVRSAAITATEALPPQAAWSAIAPLLHDPVRLVRSDAARRLAPIAPQVPPGTPGLDDFAAAWVTFEESITINSDRAGPLVDHATVIANRGEIEPAIKEMQRALKIEPWYVPASINLADMFRAVNQDASAIATLKEALKHNPDAAIIYFGLGLAYVREQDHEAALTAFEKATQLSPDDAHFHYMYAVALHDTGHPNEALTVLNQNLAKFPYNHELLSVAIDYNVEKGDLEQVRKWAQQMLHWWPDDQRANQVLQQMPSGDS